MSLINPIDAIPNQKSGTAEWTSYWDALVSRYNKNTAATVFSITWKQHKGTNADVVAIRNYTKLPLDNEKMLDGLRSAGLDAVGIFSGIGQATKMTVYVVVGITVVLLGGLVVRIITASAKDLGTAGGAAAKVFI